MYHIYNSPTRCLTLGEYSSGVFQECELKARSGEVEAMYTLAVLFEHGTGVAVDPHAAFTWYPSLSLFLTRSVLPPCLKGGVSRCLGSESRGYYKTYSIIVLF